VNTDFSNPISRARAVPPILLDALACAVRAEEAAGNPARALVRLQEFSDYVYGHGVERARKVIELAGIDPAEPAAERLRECRERSPEELAKLAPNMRAALDCPRERAPLHVELELDGVVVYRREARPAGVQRDGAAAVYHRMTVPAGKHRLIARLRDRPQGDFNYVREEALELAPGASLVIDFSAAQGGFVFKG